MHCGPAGKSDQSLQQKQDSLECPTSLRRSNFCDEFTQLSGNLQADKCTKSYKHEACSCECKDVCDTLGGGEWPRIEWRRVNEEEWRRVNGRPWVGAKTPSLLHMWTPLLCEPLSSVTCHSVELHPNTCTCIRYFNSCHIFLNCPFAFSQTATLK